MVGEQAIDPPSRQPTSPAAIVNGPCVHAQARVVRPPDPPPGCERVKGMPSLAPQSDRLGQGAVRIPAADERKGKACRPEPLEQLGVKRGDQESLTQSGAPHDSQEAAQEGAAGRGSFQLEIDPHSPRDEAKGLRDEQDALTPKPWMKPRPRIEPGKPPVGDSRQPADPIGRSLQPIVMEDDQPPVARHLHIQLDHVCAHPSGLADGGPRALRSYP